MGVLILCGLLFVPTGLALVLGAVVVFLKGKRDIEQSVAATGSVVELVLRQRVLCPVVEFTSPAGGVVRFESPFGTRPASHEVGQAIAIRYDPADPRKAFIDSALATWLVPAIMTGLGLLFIAIGGILLVIGAVFFEKV
ncbi:DUF3592 domain-containing protein [bacterium]|nr:DUF3592 domain-containing protein [bacterium]